MLATLALRPNFLKIFWQWSLLSVWGWVNKSKLIIWRNNQVALAVIGLSVRFILFASLHMEFSPMTYMFAEEAKLADKWNEWNEEAPESN